jgi:hypothetical protein
VFEEVGVGPNQLFEKAGGPNLTRLKALELPHPGRDAAPRRAARNPRAGRFWPLARALGCGFLLAQQYYLPRAWGAWAQAGTQGVYVAMIAAGVLRFLLLMRGLGSNELPDPSKVPGMPIAGPASPHAAHAAINRHRAAARRPWSS